MVGNPRWNLDFLDWRGVVTEKWKYAFYETGHEWLFDLENDPNELVNLIEREPAKALEMKQLLLDLMKETREPYFDVLVEHGAKVQSPVRNVSPGVKGGISPVWDGIVERED